ncbi:NADP-dependent oxidoreductase domain-containing protein [Phascolomyces articulosus]|uniref:NADP-dependent oxidoreductase domain-containing protein n=1 Tax=Phascolomyces articulosus TaxID=60185 RepID=A0AAD5K8N5_9FUNG|nr:NADP-dependent oxidoreductase domain-containing protein [Phascolomyces articulosus]
MLMSASPVKLDPGVIPTKDTKIVLAGSVEVPPIGKHYIIIIFLNVWSWTPEAEKDAKEAFDAAIELGIPFYDTAEVYGKGESEREINRFREKYSPEDRQKQIIATKYFPYEDRTDFPDVLLSALRDSLARLGVDKVDLYQIHAPIHPVAIPIVADALADAHAAGLVTTVGVSNYNSDEIKEMYEALKKRGIQLASNQVSYSLVRTIPEKSGLIKTCHDLGVAILAYSPIGMGLLTGKFGADGPFPESRKKRFESFDKEQLRQLLGVLQRLATKYDRQQSAIALNWCISKGTIPLGGARTAEHVRQNAAALGFLLTPEEVSELDKFAFLGENKKEWNHG